MSAEFYLATHLAVLIGNVTNCQGGDFSNTHPGID
jgi:hypothetical protein